jgi:predicted DNA-binding transcriptional regulator YafY
MPANKSALLRYRIIDKCIRNKYKPYPSKEFIRQACEDALFNSVGERVSTSTIEKDLNAMRFDAALGYEAPIKFSKADGGYYYEDPNYSIDNIPINDDDLHALRFAATTLHQFKGIKVFEDFEFAIGKLFERINLSVDSDENAIQQYVQFETVTKIEGSEHLPVLLEAIQNQKQIEIEYASYKAEKTKSYTLNAHLLKEYRNRWYLIAIDHKAQKLKTYGLDRILQVTLSNNKFERDSTFSHDHFFKYSVGITASTEKPKKVVLSFNPQQGQYVKSQPIHFSQKIITDSKKELRVEIEVIESYELVMQILGYGSSVKVISPKSLKKAIVKESQKALENYN